MVPLVNMMLSEVIFGGVGAGMYGMLIYIVLTVFIAGLMVGRTPEYLGKKIEAYDVKMAMLVALVFPLVILTYAAISSIASFGVSSIANAGPHGLSEIIYAFTSQAANNGSAFGGLNGNTPWYNLTGGYHHALGTLLHDHPHAGHRRKPRAEEVRAAFTGHVPRDLSAVHRASDGRHHHRRRTHIFPGLEPGTDP